MSGERELTDRTKEDGAAETSKRASVDGKSAKRASVDGKAPAEKKKPAKEAKQKEPKQQQGGGKKKDADADIKGITILKERDLSGWYQEILAKGDFLEYSDVPGCYILNVRHAKCQINVAEHDAD